MAAGRKGNQSRPSDYGGVAGAKKRCKERTCFADLDANSHYVYCPTCRHARRKDWYSALCLSPGCGQRFLTRAVSREAVKEWKNKFCPVCKKNFGNRYKALALQSERGKPITEIIIEAGR